MMLLVIIIGLPGMWKIPTIQKKWNYFGSRILWHVYYYYVTDIEFGSDGTNITLILITPNVSKKNPIYVI